MVCVWFMPMGSGCVAVNGSTGPGENAMVSSAGAADVYTKSTDTGALVKSPDKRDAVGASNVSMITMADSMSLGRSIERASRR